VAGNAGENPEHRPDGRAPGTQDDDGIVCHGSNPGSWDGVYFALQKGACRPSRRLGQAGLQSTGGGRAPVLDQLGEALLQLGEVQRLEKHGDALRKPTALGDGVGG
jgi:hypothetical protein